MFYFVMTEDFTYRDSKYVLDLNVDLNYNPENYYKCRNGLFCCREVDVPQFLNNGSKLAFISIPDDAKAEFAGSRIQADKIVVTKIIDLKDWEMWENEEFCIKAIRRYSNVAKYIKNPEILFNAIKWNPLALEFVENQTEEMCLEAVSRQPYTIQFVKNRTDKICAKALEKEPLTLRYVKNQNERMCLEAVTRNGWALHYVEKPTIYMCLIARKQCEWITPYALELMDMINRKHRPIEQY